MALRRRSLRRRAYAVVVAVVVAPVAMIFAARLYDAREDKRMAERARRGAEAAREIVARGRQLAEGFEASRGNEAGAEFLLGGGGGGLGIGPPPERRGGRRGGGRGETRDFFAEADVENEEAAAARAIELATEVVDAQKALAAEVDAKREEYADEEKRRHRESMDREVEKAEQAAELLEKQKEGARAAQEEIRSLLRT